MASSIPLQVAETIQTAHINTNPSVEHDVNPSTAASKKAPVILEKKPRPDDAHTPLFHDDGIDLDDDKYEDETEDDEEDMPYSVLKRPRRAISHLPPIPDLRYEQSYLQSIRNADTWWKVVWITTRDQVMMPFVQGIAYNMLICGWQHWNKGAKLSGRGIGVRVRRWWYGVNNWPVPPLGAKKS
ncbi:hypothetical protein B0H67DRAFT_494213 [Lasiosphaeris hirsuta]|uniref:DUF1770-domain-containing protein n=1 Tax=Lasiosphaeris hirsuta TaxID=260670 RepID=A0AA40A7X6_9PEZI|nr:hypothetical protein B0H67DRAFT_494213 [Lasiosphaeris hirsuta]